MNYKCPITKSVCHLAKTSHVTEINKGQVKHFDICESCPYHSNHLLEEQTEESLNFLIDQIKSLSNLKKKKITEIPCCPKCKANAEFILKNSKFGCDECYRHYEKVINNVLKYCQPSDQHVGKIPKKWKANKLSFKEQDDIGTLKLKMAKFLELEQYEKVSEIKKIIDKLEGKT
jgi:protein arginine kinase activator